MDNERPIEKLLRDYAKKRRADAGEPREMHPATRRLLQGEVARQFPKAKGGGSFFAEFFARWRPGLVYGICVLAVIAISVPVLLTTFRKADSTSRLAKVRSNDAADKKLQAVAPTLPTAPTLAEADEKLPTRDTARPNEDDANGLRLGAEREKVQTARSLTSDALARNVPAAPPTVSQNISRDQTAKQAAETQDRFERSAREARRAFAEEPTAGVGGTPLATRSPGGAPAPATAPVVAESAESAAFRQRYGIPTSASAAPVQKNSQPANVVRFRRSAGTDAEVSAVLTTFQFEQTGDQLRVIDSDGSTYTGKLTAAAPAPAGAKVELKGGPVMKAGDAAATGAKSAPADFNYQVGQNYSFRVTGTNQTLRQPVVFAGNLSILTNASPIRQTAVTPSPEVRGQFAPTQNQLPVLLNSTISGNVQLGTNKEMPIKAVPVKQ
jgi:hypothetical protein